MLAGEGLIPHSGPPSGRGRWAGVGGSVGQSTLLVLRVVGGGLDSTPRKCGYWVKYSGGKYQAPMVSSSKKNISIAWHHLQSAPKKNTGGLNKNSSGIISVISFRHSHH